jgi:hypothetical protein
MEQAEVVSVMLMPIPILVTSDQSLLVDGIVNKVY